MAICYVSYRRQDIAPKFVLGCSAPLLRNMMGIASLHPSSALIYDVMGFAKSSTHRAKFQTRPRSAALTPPADKPDQTQATDLPRTLQTELRRVGCNTGAVDGNWNAAAQRSLDLFNKHAGMKLDVKIASVEALDAVKAKTDRICPLICDHGFKVEGDRCTRIACRKGYEVGDDNTCEKIEMKKPTAKRDEPTKERQERARTEASPSRPQASGQLYCSQQGCRPVAKGCRIEIQNGYTMGGNQREVCN